MIYLGTVYSSGYNYFYEPATNYIYYVCGDERIYKWLHVISSTADDIENGEELVFDIPINKQYITVRNTGHIDNLYHALNQIIEKIIFSNI